MFFSSYKRNIKLLLILLIIFTILLAILSILNNYLPFISSFGSLPFLITNLIILIILFLVAKESSKYGKKAFRGWILIALSILFTLLGNITWIVLLKYFNQPSSPSIADIFYLAYYPLMIIGILHLPVTKTHEIKKYQILLDTGILIVSVALILWISLINPILHSDNSVSMITSLSYLLLDIFLLFTLVYLLFNWFGQVKKIPLSLLTMSAAVLVITNIIFIFQFLYGIYNSSGVLDAGWLISYILTAMAGISYITNEKIKYIPSFPYKLSIKINWSSYLPLLWLLFIYLLLFWIYTHPEGSNLNVLIGGAGIIITMVFIRQILALEDSNRTREQLQSNRNILEKREKHLSLITDNMMDLITQSDAKGIYQYVSPSSKKILGYNMQNILGKNVLDFVHPNDHEMLKLSFQNAGYNCSPNEIEYRYKKDSGDYIWLETVGTPIFDNERNLNGFICSSRNIDDRKQAEEHIKLSLEEKEILLKEIHHRVKNNMQIISSLLNLQSRYVEDNNLEILKESQNRVKSMAMIHENLYKSGNLARINFGEYIQKLVSGLFSSYGINSSMIKLQTNLDDVLIDINTAIPCGLILNELISNSIKHAFPKTFDHGPINRKLSYPTSKIHGAKNESFPEQGKMNISLSKEYEDVLKIVVSDNGIGFPEAIDFQNTESLGLQLVNTLVKQIDGKIELERNNGTKFILKIEKND